MTRQLINPPGTEATYKSFQFSQAVRVGDTVWVSGQVGFGPDGIPSSMKDQAQLALESLKKVLEEAGATLGDVVQLTSYHTDMSEMREFAGVKSEFFPQDYPAWTAVGVTALVLPDLRVEVQATARIGSAEVERS